MLELKKIYMIFIGNDKSPFFKDDVYIRRVTKGGRHLFGMIYGDPDKEHAYYWVMFGEYGDFLKAIDNYFNKKKIA